MLTLQRVAGAHKVFRSGMIVVFITFFIFMHSFATAEISPGSDSLSELNFNTEERVFFKDIPWAKKDPFRHPSFDIKKPAEKAEPEEPKDGLLKDVKPPKLDLSAILYTKKGKSAVINGRIVKAGSIIKRQKLLEISEDHIKAEYNGKVYKIMLRDFTITDDEE
jgi:hypothetical protein